MFRTLPHVCCSVLLSLLLVSVSHAQIVLTIDTVTENYNLSGSDTGQPQFTGAITQLNWTVTSFIGSINFSSIQNPAVNTTGWTPTQQFAILSESEDLGFGSTSFQLLLEHPGDLSSVTTTVTPLGGSFSYSGLSPTSKAWFEGLIGGEIPLGDGTNFSPIQVVGVSHANICLKINTVAETWELSGSDTGTLAPNASAQWNLFTFSLTGPASFNTLTQNPAVTSSLGSVFSDATLREDNDLGDEASFNLIVAHGGALANQPVSVTAISGINDYSSFSAPAKAWFEGLIGGEIPVILGTGFSPIKVVRVGDANGDGVLNNFDIASFGLALFQPVAYAAMFPGVDPDCVLDMNGDGVLNNFDISGFGTALGF